jgi:hypothetical protein
MPAFILYFLIKKGGLHALAKLWEIGDRQVWQITGQRLSSHSLTHLVVAMVTYLSVWGLVCGVPFEGIGEA